MISYSFDAIKHEYKINDYIVPSVTQIIQGIFGKREWYSEWHANRGQAIHLAIHYLVNNILDWNTVDERILPRIKTFNSFLNDMNYGVIESEIRLYSSKMMFAGTLDLLLYDKKNDEYIIADIKSTIEPIVEIQLGGYYILFKENHKNKISKLIAIELKDNKYNIMFYYDLKRAQKLFKSCLTIYNFKKARRIL